MTKLSIAAFLLVLSVSYGLTKADLTMEQKLSELRAEMAQRGYSAYIILTDDEHQSEYTAEYDRRRAWISGFTGSAGTAVVTMSNAALWTDSRYYAQADIQLDKNYWMLMKASERDTPKIDEWLGTELTSGETVGLMAKFTPIDTWKSYENGLNHHGITLTDAETDLIDRIWTPAQGRPPKPNSKIFIYDIAFAGLSWEDKVDQIKTKMTSEGADLFVVSALDEVAWVLNMRGADVPNNPFFFAYLILRKNGPHTIYIENNRLDDELKHHLNGVQIKDYNSVESDIKAASDSGSSIWLSPVSSYAIYNAVSNKDEDKFIMKASPIRSIKARKNSVELRNLRTCHIRDSVARIRHMYWVETELEKGTEITEKSSADMLKSIQAQDPHYVSSSFGSISAVGKNAAIIHYSTAEGDNSKLTKNHIYLLDAGAQYLDCSTDITRTHHYGTPTQEEITAYTLTLQGATNLASLVFPQGVQGRDLDVEARKPFWQIGEDFGHGTGHGIGYFLSIHESPPTTNYASRSVYNEGFDAGMVQSDEPGFYVDGSFGIRLETDIESVETKTEYPYGTRQYLKFEPLNYVPFEKNLINECMLTNEQVDWLNKYNKDIREKVGLRLFDYPEVRKFMIKKTEPFLYAHQHKKCQKKSKWSLF